MAYHYGRHVLASHISEFLGIPLEDSVTRMLQMLGLASLVLAAISLGAATARTPRERPLSGLLAVVLTFFLPSFFMLVLTGGLRSSRIPQRILDIPYAGLGTSSGLGHFYDGSSLLWCGIIVFALASLLVQSGSEDVSRRPSFPWAALLLSVLSIALNGVAGICCLACVMLLAWLDNCKNWRCYLFLLAAVASIGSSDTWSVSMRARRETVHSTRAMWPYSRRTCAAPRSSPCLQCGPCVSCCLLGARLGSRRCWRCLC